MAGEVSQAPEGGKGQTNWVAQNWDKVLVGVLSIVVSGVIGFFAAIRAVDGDISSIKQDLASIKTEGKLYLKKDDLNYITKDLQHLDGIMDNLVIPSTKEVKEHNTRISSFKAHPVVPG
jgi:hypothetical protein